VQQCSTQAILAKAAGSKKHLILKQLSLPSFWHAGCCAPTAGTYLLVVPSSTAGPIDTQHAANASGGRVPKKGTIKLGRSDLLSLCISCKKKNWNALRSH